MTEAITAILFAVEYAGDQRRGIGAVTFIVLLNIDHGLD